MATAGHAWQIVGGEGARASRFGIRVSESTLRAAYRCRPRARRDRSLRGLRRRLRRGPGSRVREYPQSFRTLPRRYDRNRLAAARHAAPQPRLSTEQPLAPVGALRSTARALLPIFRLRVLYRRAEVVEMRRRRQTVYPQQTVCRRVPCSWMGMNAKSAVARTGVASSAHILRVNDPRKRDQQDRALGALRRARG